MHVLYMKSCAPPPLLPYFVRSAEVLDSATTGFIDTSVLDTCTVVNLPEASSGITPHCETHYNASSDEADTDTQHGAGEFIECLMPGIFDPPHLPSLLSRSHIQVPAERFPLDVIDKAMAKCMGDENVFFWLGKHSEFSELVCASVPADGNCLCHSAAFLLWGYGDKFIRGLRFLIQRAVDNASPGSELFERWSHSEKQDNMHLGITVTDEQLQDSWQCNVVKRCEPVEENGTVVYQSLESFHIFVLANVIRRPIIVLGGEFVKDSNGDAIQPNSMLGIYLPLLSAPQDCWAFPLLMAYHNSHFTPLLPRGGCYVPLLQRTGYVLPIPFAMEADNIRLRVGEYLLMERVDVGDEQPWPSSCIQTESCLPGLLLDAVEDALQTHTSHQCEEHGQTDESVADISVADVEGPFVGRRIVELGYLAEQLKAGCCVCGEILHLHNCTGETRMGLASRLALNCDRCGSESTILTSKQHRRQDVTKGPGVFDVNTKAALGKRYELHLLIFPNYEPAICSDGFFSKTHVLHSCICKF